MFNYFMSVSAEPGGGSKYFDFQDSRYNHTGEGGGGMPSIWNTVIGQDNTFDQGETCPIMPVSCAKTNPKRPASCDEFCTGPETTDANFIYMQHGQLHLGNFSASVPLMSNETAPVAGRAIRKLKPPPKLSWEYQLQVEGNGWVRNLTHGLPHTRLGLRDEAVESVDEEPHVLMALDKHTLEISNLAHQVSGGRHQGGAFYEITIAGVGFGASECSGGVCVYSAKFLVVPVAAAPEAGVDEAFLSVTALGATSGVTLLPTTGAQAKDGTSATIVRGFALRFGLSEANETREVVVDVRHAGRPCTYAHIELV
jgi:hypothetical protein